MNFELGNNFICSNIKFETENFNFDKVVKFVIENVMLF